MKTFKQFLIEMPSLSRDIPAIKDRDESDLNHLITNPLFTGSKKISKLDKNHNIYHHIHPLDSKIHSYFIVHNKSKRIKGAIHGRTFLDEFNIRWSAKHSSAKFKMTDVYHHLVMNHTPIVSSEVHSPGSYKNWKSLSEKPGIEISAMQNGESVKAFKGDEWHKNYDNISSEHNHKLIARKK